MKQGTLDIPGEKPKTPFEEELWKRFRFHDPPDDGAPHGPTDVAVSLGFLDKPISSCRRIGEKQCPLLKKLGLKTIGDCLEYYPTGYLDRRKMTKLSEAGWTDQETTVFGRAVSSEFISTRSGKKLFKIYIRDGSGEAALVGFGRRIRALRQQLPIECEAVVIGKFKRDYGKVETSNFEIERIDPGETESVHTGRIVPKYRLTKGVYQTWLRSLIASIAREYADAVPELLPLEVRRKHALIGAGRAALQVHLPDSLESLRQATRRIIFEEMYLLRLGQEWLRKQREMQRIGIAFQTGGKRATALLNNLPFTLTNAQRRAVKEIEEDMQRPAPMYRLLQGDVGSGKTVVLALALANAVDNGAQGAIMAPTESLTQQIYETLKELFGPIGVQTVLLKSGLSTAERTAALNALETGYANVAVGTHALLEKDVKFGRLGIAVVDEQHRFGVKQRERLAKKRKSAAPDMLVVTATPIPRSLGLTYYGDMAHSVIDELPPGRKPVKTLQFGADRKGLIELFEMLEQELEKGRQAYVVYPLIESPKAKRNAKESAEASEKTAAISAEDRQIKDAAAGYRRLSKRQPEGSVPADEERSAPLPDDSPQLATENRQIKDAVEGYRRLSKWLPEYRVGLLHGQIERGEKEETLKRFREGGIDVLVSTTVIEVGIDIPNASLMAVIHADRFGLSQLHQLRGRVGRGEHQSYCALVGWWITDEANARLEAMLRTNDGFEIAKADLKIRGIGEFLGTRQSGKFHLTMATLPRDEKYLFEARKAAASFVRSNPDPYAPGCAAAREWLLRKMKGRLRLASVG